MRTTLGKNTLNAIIYIFNAMTATAAAVKRVKHDGDDF